VSLQNQTSFYYYPVQKWLQHFKKYRMAKEVSVRLDFASSEVEFGFKCLFEM
jgi:hypothetical protein